MDNNITLLVTLTIKPNMITEFIRETDFMRTLAEQTEPGCVRYDILQEKPNFDIEGIVFTLIETYISNDAIEEHKKTQHFKNWKENTKHMIINKSVTINKYI